MSEDDSSGGLGNIPTNVDGIVDDVVDENGISENANEEGPGVDTEPQLSDTEEVQHKEGSSQEASSSREQLIDNLQEVYDKKGWLPKSNDVDGVGKYIDEFGSFNEALEAAGINKRKELFDELERVWKELGEEPSQSKMNEHGECSFGMYSKYFGSWSTAKKEFKSERGTPDGTNSKDKENKEYLTFEDVSEEGRIDGKIPVLVKNVNTGGSTSKDARLSVEDLDGNRLTLDIWNKHNIQYEFEESRYYLFEQVRGKVWGSGNDVHKKLSSTRDLKVSEISDFSEVGSFSIKTEEVGEVEEGGAMGSDSTTGTKSINSTETEPKKPEEDSKPNNTKTDEEDDGSGKGVPTRDNLINDLQDIYSRIDALPLQSDINEEGNYSSWEYTYEFGSLENAYEAADINIKQELLDEIERVADELEKKPKLSDVTEHGRFSRQRYKNHFRSWSRALEKAEISVNSSSSQEEMNEGKREGTQSTSTGGGPSEEDLLQELQSIESFPSASVESVQKESKYSISEYEDKFGSLEEALEAAGIDKDQQLIDEIERVSKELGKKPTTTEFDNCGEFDSGIVTSYFGSWENALDKVDEGVVEQDIDSSRTDVLEKIEDIEDEINKKSADDSRISRVDLLNEIERISSETVGTPSAKEINNRGKYSVSEYEGEFGSVKKAIEESDVDPSQDDVRQDLIEELEAVSEEIDTMLESSDKNDYEGYEKEIYVD